MHQDSFRTVVCRSLSKSLPSRSKEGIYPEKAQSATPCVVTLQPTLCQGCQSQDWRQSNQEERCMSLHRDYLMASSLSRHFAEDLLRGAMDLQQSLVMLEKFQTVSQSMREQSNKKRRPGAGEKSPDIIGIREALLEVSNTKKAIPGSIGNQYDGQLRNSTDELRRVIKDSLYRKNLFSASCNDEQASLSQSSWPAPNNSTVSKSIKQKKVAPKSTSCTAVQPDRSKSPSLVARLMGLDGFSTHTGNTAKKDEALKTVSSPRAQFDIEMTKSKKTLPRIFGEGNPIATEMLLPEKLPKHLLGKGSDRNGKAGQETMDAMQFKRLVKTMKNDEHKVQQHNVLMNFPNSQKKVLSSCGTSVVSELGSVRPIERENGIERVRAKAPEDIKVVSRVIRRQWTEDTTETSKRKSGRQNSHLTDRKGEESKDMKTKTLSTYRNNAKSVIKCDKKLVASSSSSSTCHPTNPTSRKTPSNSRKKIVSSRNVKNTTTADIVEHGVHREFIQSDGPSTEYSATPSEESCQSADWDTELRIDADIRENFSGYNEASLATSPTERSSSTDEDAFCSPTNRPSPSSKEPEIKDELSLLLLSDQVFLARAAQLVGIQEYRHLIEQYKVTPKAGTKNSDLYIDAATEQLELKHHQQSTGFRPQKCRAIPYFSLAALLGDISNGTRKLSSYTDDNRSNNNNNDNSSTKDGLYVKLERDLWCTDAAINSAWDMGWQDWVCMEETEQCARDVGESVLAMLVDEAVLDMLVC